MNKFDMIDGWDIGADGKWVPKPCQLCNGTKVVSRPINHHNPVEREAAERGCDRWCQPCGRCSAYGLEQFANWIRAAPAQRRRKHERHPHRG